MVIADYAGKLYFRIVTLADGSDTMEVMHADCDDHAVKLAPVNNVIIRLASVNNVMIMLASVNNERIMRSSWHQ